MVAFALVIATVAALACWWIARGYAERLSAARDNLASATSSLARWQGERRSQCAAALGRLVDDINDRARDNPEMTLDHIDVQLVLARACMLTNDAKTFERDLAQVRDLVRAGDPGAPTAIQRLVRFLDSRRRGGAAPVAPAVDARYQ